MLLDVAILNLNSPTLTIMIAAIKNRFNFPFSFYLQNKSSINRSMQLFTSMEQEFYDSSVILSYKF